MDIEKLIERLYTKQQSYASYTDSELAHVLENAITALSTLQDENEEMQNQLNMFSEFLCYMTGGLLSKTNYTAQEMVTAAEDYQQKVCGECDLRDENEKLLDENRRWSEATRTLSCAIENLRDKLELKHNQHATTTEVINACALNELRAYKEIGNLDYFKRLAEMDKAGKYIQPTHLAAIRDMSRILATIGPALQGAPEEIENVLRLYDSEIKEARED